MGRFFRKLVTLLVFVLIGGGIGFVIWSNNTYQPSIELQTLIDTKEVSNREGSLVFSPPQSTPKAGVILYPGGRVEPMAYAYYAEQVAREGYLVIIPKMPFNLALFGVDKAKEWLQAYPEVTNWIVGGHSLGGVSAASFAYSHLDTIDGVIFLGAYPASYNNFATIQLNMLILSASQDGLTTPGELDQFKHLFSTETKHVVIEGGNHAQFGMYGPQDGDLPATISAQEQQDQMVRHTLDWFRNQK